MLNNLNNIIETSNMRLSRKVSPWLKCFIVRPKAQLRLICFPHAGGGASVYASWARLLPESIELWVLQLPGREDRLGEPMVDNMTTLVNILTPLIIQFEDIPYAFFGHSMGAVLGYELCLSIFRLQKTLPRRFFVSGREAPVLSRYNNLHLASDKDFIAELVRLEPTTAMLFAHQELASIVLPVIRNDYIMINSYHPKKNEPLLPVMLIGITGDNDPELLPGDIEAWQSVTSSKYTLYRFPGRHFYLNEERGAVVSLIVSLLNKIT